MVAINRITPKGGRECGAQVMDGVGTQPLRRSRWPIPCHIATRPVAVTSAALAAGCGVEATHSLPDPKGRPPMTGAGGLLATSEQALAMAAKAFLVLPSLTRCSNE
jgi:hypothetical protein